MASLIYLKKVVKRKLALQLQLFSHVSSWGVRYFETGIDMETILGIEEVISIF
jgi:hypothetical protein